MANKPNVSDVSQIAFSPQQAGRLAVDMVRDNQAHINDGFKIGISSIDTHLVPFRPGQLITVLGYTSNYKSGFMNWIAKQALKTIEPETNKIVIKVTWEQSVEEDTLSWLASDAKISITQMARGLLDEDEWKMLIGASIKRAVTPLWVVGHSQMEYKNQRKARPRMTMRDVARAMEYIIHDVTAETLSPSLVVLDYLQRIRADEQDGDNRRIQMMEAVNLSKDLGIAYGCPVVLGVQTNRAEQDRSDKIPQINDGQETSNIEQSSDVSFGLWYPIRTEAPGSSGKQATVNGYPVTKNLLFCRILKQKLGEASITYALHVDPELNNITAMAKP
jgi:replicative DNA helicase